MQYTNKGKLFTETVLEIFKLSGHLATEGDQLTQEFSLSSARWKVLGAVQMTPSLLTVAQIARVMGLTRQAVQRLADAMEKDGLLVYQENPNHKRARYVVLSGRGAKIYAAISEKQIPWANQNAKPLDLADLKATLSVLKNINMRFDPKV